MEEIELSVMSYTGERMGRLQNLLEEFEAKHQVRVHIQTLTWESSWSEILKFVFQGHGPAVSEVGNTWVSSLGKMSALRYFSDDEVEEIGGAKAFIPATWHHDPSIGEPIWSIPWLAESRVILYRQDLLEKAGIEEETAFDTHNHLEKTLTRLEASGVDRPWIVPTQKTTNTLHTLPSWIWGAGGDFVDARHRRVTFADPKARSGIRDYYSLHRFLSPEFHGINPYQAETRFLEGQAAVTVSGPWTVFPPNPLPEPNVHDKIDVAIMPGVSCVLASDLVVWKHTPVRHEQLAVELVQFLTAKKTQHACSQHTGLLPARLETIKTKPFSTDPFYQVFVRALMSGRPLPNMRLWGLIEERLTSAFGILWHKILADPDPDLDALIKAELDPLAQKINRILE
jgi:multiple sugar transport system substrate-binding protein